MRRYSRLASLEERKNLRQAVVFGVLTITFIILLLFFGLPTVAKFAGFLTDLTTSEKPIEKNDTTPPAPPRLDPLPDATKEQKIQITGTTEPSALVALTLNDKQEEIVADAEGKFSFQYTLKKGENTIIAFVKDTSGNISQNSQEVKIVFDNEVPTLEITSPADGSQFFGSRERQVTIQGKTEADISLTINERVIAVGEDGSFVFATSLSEGDNTFTIKAADKAGNQSEKSLMLHYSS